MYSTPVLSVVIPVFNGESFLGRCIESVLNQSLKDIQIIVVDDGSNDCSVNEALKYVQIYPNVQLVKHTENLGTGVARNTGMGYATGKYTAFLDADDWIDTNVYLELTTALDKTFADIALCGIRTEHSNALLSTVRYYYPHSNLISGKFALKLLCKTEMQDTFISPMVGNKVFRTDFIRTAMLSFPQRKLFEDDEFMFLAFCKAAKVIIIPDVYHHYFQRETSTMHSFSKQYIDCLLQAFRCIYDELNKADCFVAYETEYYAFLDRCITSLLDTLFSCEQSVAVQRRYITYLFEQLLTSFTLEELLSHMEPRRLYRIWLRS